MEVRRVLAVFLAEILPGTEHFVSIHCLVCDALWCKKGIYRFFFARVCDGLAENVFRIYKGCVWAKKLEDTVVRIGKPIPNAVKTLEHRKLYGEKHPPVAMTFLKCRCEITHIGAFFSNHKDSWTNETLPYKIFYNSSKDPNKHYFRWKGFPGGHSIDGRISELDCL